MKNEGSENPLDSRLDYWLWKLGKKILDWTSARD